MPWPHLRWVISSARMAWPLIERRYKPLQTGHDLKALKWYNAFWDSLISTGDSSNILASYQPHLFLAQK